jgi:hypothetical protein
MNDSDLNVRSCVKATECLIAVLRSERTDYGMNDLDISFVWNGKTFCTMYTMFYCLHLIFWTYGRKVVCR